ncbi:MAG: arsenical resistance operon transcriptional repressor ArsD [Nitrospirae bacterium CG18_big_fil_WC_8_21_14_2_50_70_55]|nr:arsenite efflux transporter metallochaperone ArsD [Deltaproteobacteria bacterium]OIP64448.1 MAG: hypothetical protein AUK30_06810 [Nitrospirae bacterium CG2_30_70_394]PIQ05585.1 MAG: arsenical resistance operon transcriptional repressor ArsD [Nitrospirae bacterium CG18_big_fil_WC_8_21_14_2_50_70_55]PIU77441.1 MAG: arsenical resistance operon transcriptional repressor ArsD [Nitrospirae bacterium CG06_land_8_20_14_3_00_70_43]PIW83935.1 MAG: arsenical resistance operon transcriptional repressor
MTLLSVFDPPMCCASGVCGSTVDPALVRFAADLRWLEAHGVRVVRHNLAQEPGAFVAEPAVQAALAAEGATCLPLLVVDGEIRERGRYPDRATLAPWFGLATEARVEPFVLRAVAPPCPPAPGDGRGKCC